MEFITATRIFRNFRDKHRRGTDFILKLYDIDQTYVIGGIYNDLHSNWYRFKRLCKMAEEENMPEWPESEYQRAKHLLRTFVENVKFDEKESKESAVEDLTQQSNLL